MSLIIQAFGANAPKETTVSLGAFDVMMSASPVVQLVLLVLLLFSVFSWAIIWAKWNTFRRCLKSTDNFLDVFWSGKSLDQIYNESKKFTGSSLARIFQSGYVELQRLIEKDQKKTSSTTGLVASGESAMFNLERALNRASRSESLRLERSLTFLATAGSTAPFIGLFGTVWGIMNAFQNIGMQGAASLATVAPGIAEALIATAVGLACAIPAVMGYNYYNGKVRKFRAQMENFSGDLLNIIRRNFVTG